MGKRGFTGLLTRVQRPGLVLGSGVPKSRFDSLFLFLRVDVPRDGSSGTRVSIGSGVCGTRCGFQSGPVSGKSSTSGRSSPYLVSVLGIR